MNRDAYWMLLERCSATLADGNLRLETVLLPGEEVILQPPEWSSSLREEGTGS